MQHDFANLGAQLLVALLLLSGIRAAESDAPLSGEEQTRVEGWIKQFDADDFATRDGAQRRLLELGFKVHPYLVARHAEIKKRRDASLEVLSRLQAAIAALETLEEQRRTEEIIKDAERAIREAPARYVPPDPETLKKLSDRKITFEFVDTHLEDALCFIGRHAGVRILCDPKLLAEGIENTPITLRVADMDCELAIKWVVRLADVEYAVRGKAIFVTKDAKPLKLQSRTFGMPVAAGEPPWTMEETKYLAGLVNDWPICHNVNVDGMQYSPLEPTLSHAEAPGKLLLRSVGFEGVEEFINSLSGSPPPLPDIPAWVRDAEKKLDAKVSFVAEKKPLQESLALLATQLKIEILIDPMMPGSASATSPPITLTAKEMPARDCLIEILRLADLAISYRASEELISLFVTRREDVFLVWHPCVLDLRPALRAGLPQDELWTKLNDLIPNKGRLGSRILRGRWLAKLDPWTAQRALSVVNQAAKTGKVSEPPPAPWFFKTWQENYEKDKK